MSISISMNIMQQILEEMRQKKAAKDAATQTSGCGCGSAGANRIKKG